MTTKNPCILAIDQGTSSSRAILFSANGVPLYTAQREFTQYYPQNGWVEHDPDELWSTTLYVSKAVAAYAKDNHYTIEGIGITNQRETTMVWDKETGKTLGNAIVWQDRRTADICKSLKDQGKEALVTAKTGLLLDPYFSATKLQWILDHYDGAHEKARQGKLACGTVDTFLLWHLTGGTTHATDATNASRTLLFNIHSQAWDDELLSLFSIPKPLLPEVKDSATHFGTTAAGLFDNPFPIYAVIGDQQAATVGQGCFTPGMVKTTFGTGCFLVMHTGDKPVTSQHKLLTTVAYRLKGKPSYALEGSVFIAGAVVQWLRDKLHFVKSSAETEALAASLTHNAGVYLVPAFTGLGAPYWNPDARGALFGLTRDTGIAEISRAALESVAYQTVDLLRAIAGDGMQAANVRVDGGMSSNNWLMQFLSDIAHISVTRPVVNETTALGAAYLAGLQAGLYTSLEDIAAHWKENATFKPTMQADVRDQLLAGWDRATALVNNKI